MANFPNTFAERGVELNGQTDLGEEGNAARDRLAEKGFVVISGLTRFTAGAVSAAAAQRHITEFCPKDPTPKRFGTERSTEKWLGKGGGRGAFILGKLMGDNDIRVAGYGWTGAEDSEVAEGAETTFAVRVTNEGRGNKAGADFSTVIVAGSAALHGARKHWLECWKYNPGAVKAYEETGWVPVTDAEGQPVERKDIRPTNYSEGYEFDDGTERRVFMHQTDSDPAPRPYVEDVRLWYTYPDDRLPQPAAA